MDSLNIAIRSTGGIDKYPAKAHARRVAEKLGLNTGIIGLCGTRSVFFSNSDQKQPFRQDRYFYYLSGCDEPDCGLVYDIAKDFLTLLLPRVDYARYFYDGRGSTVEEALERYDVDDAQFNLAGYAHLASTGRLITLEDRRAGYNVVSTRLRSSMDACRSVKDEHEIRLIRRANDISAAAYKDVLLQLHDCNSEAEAEAVYMRRCIASSAKKQSYEPIFGAGVNASTLHYIDNSASFNDSQLLLIDAGCEWERYASDVTRTVPINRKKPGHWPSQEAQQLYQAVESIQEKCITLMKPGVKFSFVAWTAQQLAIDALLDLGILKGDAKAIWQAGTSRAFFPHGLGHHLGLEVHDVPPPTVATTETEGRAIHRSASYQQWDERSHGMRYAAHDCTDEPAMEAGNVITIEPGLYFNDFVLRRFFVPVEKHREFIDLDVLERFMPLGGVRIEDDILITKDGHENLTTAPKGAEMLEILRRHR